MSTVNVQVASISRIDRIAWIGQVGSILDAGNDVTFIDENGMATDVSRIHLDTDGTVVILGRHDVTGKTLFFAGGGFLEVPGIYMIKNSVSGGTTTGLNISVKVV